MPNARTYRMEWSVTVISSPPVQCSATGAAMHRRTIEHAHNRVPQDVWGRHRGGLPVPGDSHRHTSPDQGNPSTPWVIPAFSRKLSTIPEAPEQPHCSRSTPRDRRECCPPTRSKTGKAERHRWARCRSSIRQHCSVFGARPSASGELTVVSHRVPEEPHPERLSLVAHCRKQPPSLQQEWRWASPCRRRIDDTVHRKGRESQVVHRADRVQHVILILTRHGCIGDGVQAARRCVPDPVRSLKAPVCRPCGRGSQKARLSVT